MKYDLTMVQFPYARHRATRCRLLLVRRDGLREPTCGDLGRRDHLHLRQQRQRDRDRLSGLHLGLAQPPGERREKRRGHHHLRLRSHRPAGVPGDGECDDLVPQPVLQRRLELAHRDDHEAHLLAGWDAPRDGGRRRHTTASTTYLHPDHLGGTNVATDEDGEVAQTLDYYPYGSQRIATGSFSEQRRFIGEEYDGDTEFSYLNARYYQGSRGQFMSQDPVFLAVGDAGAVREITQKTLRAILADPQSLNSYSYAGNNPILFKDSTGKWYVDIGASFTAGPLTGGGGIRISNQGLVGYYSGGGGFGLYAGGGIQFNSGNINVGAPEFTIADEITFGGGPSITTSYEGKFNPDDPLRVGEKGTRTFGIGAGLGGRINKIYTQTIPIRSWTQDACANCNSANPNGSTSVRGVSSTVPASGSRGPSQDTWAILRAAISQYYAEGGK